MKCPECQTEVDEKLKYCPNCGAPVPQHAENAASAQQAENATAAKTSPKPSQSKAVKEEPRLGKKMMIFIVVGLALILIFCVVHCISHRNDPEYFRTAIEPDSTLADKDLVVFDTVAVDSAAAKKAEKEEKKEAEKIYNSIRRKSEPKEEPQNTDNNSDNQEAGTSSSSEGQTPATPEVVAPTPKVESIETE